MACTPNQVAAMWQRFVEHRLSPERLAAFLKHDAMPRLTKFELADLEAAAKRAKAANASGHLLLNDWLEKVWELKTDQLKRITKAREAAVDRGSGSGIRRRESAKPKGKPVVDPTDYQLRANRPKWHGPRKPWEPM